MAAFRRSLDVLMLLPAAWTVAGDSTLSIAVAWLWVPPARPTGVAAFSDELRLSIRHLLQVHPQLAPAATLWIGGSLTNVSDLPADLNGALTVRALPTTVLGVKMTGYAAKAWVLIASRVRNGYIVFFDGDVFQCEGWLGHLTSTALTSGYDVVWSLEAEGVRCGGYRNGSCALAVSPSIANNATELAEYVSFGERNTGTVFAVRRSSATVAWMRDTIRLYGQLIASGLVTGNGGLADQPAWRESFFLHRNSLKERLIWRQQACHKMLIAPKNCSCWCTCGPCLYVHGHNAARQCLGILGHVGSRPSTGGQGGRWGV